MAGRVIQGFFPGGAMPANLATPLLPQHPPAPVTRRTVPAPVQPKALVGRPQPAHPPNGVVQRHGGNGNFDIDPVRLGLARSGGAPLPTALLAKMEAAFGADFSSVRVHVGPQAARIGAIAFTTGNDLYFAPGRYQPDSVQGQQLIGHELAHVIQQRQGRVRASGNGVAVVQDHALEAEADRLGMKAAMHRAPLQPKPAPTPLQRKLQPGAPGPILAPAPGRVPPLARAGLPLQPMMVSGGTGGSGGNGGNNGNNWNGSSHVLSNPPSYTGKLSNNRVTWRRRLWLHFGMNTFTVDQFCTFVNGYGSITTRPGQMTLLRDLRTAGALFPPITENVRDGLTLSFDSSLAQQAPNNSGYKMTNRQAFGMSNPPHNHPNMLDLWEEHAHTPPPKGRDPMTHYMSPNRNYFISDNDGNPVLDKSGNQVMEQGHSNLVMGHNPSASTYINNTGHMYSPGTNRKHNYSSSTYGQIENKYASAKSGSKEPRYRSPSPTRGSWEGYYQRDHKRFKEEYRRLWPYHIRKRCRHCGNDTDHEKRIACSACGTHY
jgi:hypothetical protein